MKIKTFNEAMETLNALLYQRHESFRSLIFECQGITGAFDPYTIRFMRGYYGLKKADDPLCCGINGQDEMEGDYAISYNSNTTKK